MVRGAASALAKGGKDVCSGFLAAGVERHVAPEPTTYSEAARIALVALKTLDCQRKTSLKPPIFIMSTRPNVPFFRRS